MRALKVLGLGVLWLAATAWACGALWVDGPTSRTAAAALVVGFVAVAAALTLAIRPRWRGFALFALWVGIVIAWQLRMEPRNDRDWLPEVRQLPTATLEGDWIVLENVRNFEYRSETDFTERWEQRRYDLRKLRGVDLFLSYWGSPWIAHVIMSWDFGEQGHLAISIETRKEKGESYSALRGFFRQYELYYVLADERDVVGLRTNVRGEQVYLYRLLVPVERSRAILLSYLSKIDQLAQRPEWYNAITENCTTSVRHRIASVGPTQPWNWRILLNGRLDELLYARREIDTHLPFVELRQTSEITSRAQSAGGDADFSAAIRLPAVGSGP